MDGIIAGNDSHSALDGVPTGHCRQCGMAAPLASDARYCGACGAAWPLGRIEPVLYILPLWQLALYSVLSLGIYLVPWAMRVARFVRAARGEETTRWSGVGRALTLLIPIYNLVAFLRLVADTRTAVGAAEDEAPHPGLSLSLLLVAGVLARGLPDWWALLALPILIAALWPVQRAINAHCMALAHGAGPSFRRPGPTAIAGLVLAFLLWGLVGLGLAGPTALDALLGHTPVADGSIDFGHNVDHSGRALRGITRHFHLSDQIAWIARFAQPLSSNAITLEIDQQHGHAWSAVMRLPETIPGASGASYIYDHLPLAVLATNWPHPTSHFRMRYWAQGRVIAQGTFDVTA